MSHDEPVNINAIVLLNNLKGEFDFMGIHFSNSSLNVRRANYYAYNLNKYEIISTVSLLLLKLSNICEYLCLYSKCTVTKVEEKSL